MLLGVTTGVAGNALYDLIKKVLVKQGVRKHTHIEEMKKPDGTRLLVIDVEEKRENLLVARSRVWQSYASAKFQEARTAQVR